MTDTPTPKPIAADEFQMPALPEQGKIRGRKTLLTAELTDAVVRLLKAGNYLSQTARYLGLNPTTLNSWRARGNELMESGREDLTEYEQMFVDFAISVEAAKAEAEIRAVEIVRKAMPKDWRAATWYLERTNNKDWGATQRTEVSGPDGGAIPIDVDSVYRKLEAVTQRVVLDAEEAHIAELPTPAPQEKPQLLPGGEIAPDAVVVEPAIEGSEMAVEAEPTE